jgi:hypothetical protein
MNNEDCIVALSSGPTTFRSTSVKPYFTEKDQENQLIQPANTDNQENKDTITVELPAEYTPQTAAQPPDVEGQERFPSQILRLILAQQILNQILNSHSRARRKSMA